MNVSRETMRGWKAGYKGRKKKDDRLIKYAVSHI